MRRRPSASLKLSCTQQGTITILELDSFTDGVGSYTMTLSQLLFVFTDEVLLTDPPPIPSASPPHVLSVNTFIIGYDLRCWSEKIFFKMLLGSTPFEEMSLHLIPNPGKLDTEDSDSMEDSSIEIGRVDSAIEPSRVNRRHSLCCWAFLIKTIYFISINREG